MKDLIKHIRTELGLTQEQLAQKMNVSPITINRWENEKAMPNTMAQKVLYDICKASKLDLAYYVVDQYTDHSEKLVLYHASRKGISGIIRPCSRTRCDFGQGFYMGTEPIQPLTLVCNENKPMFYQMAVDLDDLQVLHVDVNIDWAMLIAYYRGYMHGEEESSLYHKYAHMADGYDMIIGYIADDRMYQVLTDFFEGRITDTALIASLSALNLGKQYVAVTQKACDHIAIISEKEITYLEKLILKEKSEIRRREGLSLARKVVIEHRRDGRFFDEILKGVNP